MGKCKKTLKKKFKMLKTFLKLYKNEKCKKKLFHLQRKAEKKEPILFCVHLF